VGTDPIVGRLGGRSIATCASPAGPSGTRTATEAFWTYRRRQNGQAGRSGWVLGGFGIPSRGWAVRMGRTAAGGPASARAGVATRRPAHQRVEANGGRKVKRLLNDAGVTGHERSGWPVVLSGDRIVWIPGVRRSDAATAQSEAGRQSWPFLCTHG
jgi:tRNA(Ile)-lysidine synthetase-like protein